MILANLPEFLRTPILKKRLLEFFSMSQQEKTEIIRNALEAGPAIPFPNFSKLFKTWLEVLSTMTEEQRSIMFSNYIYEIAANPQRIINFNLDGILEIFLSLDNSKRAVIANSVRNIFSRLDDNQRRRLLMVIPENAKTALGI